MKCYNFIFPWSYTWVKSSFESWFHTNLYESSSGMKGLARFVSDHIVKTDTGESIYACYDRSRDVFKYKNEAGEYINDIKAVRLVEIIHPAAAEHSRSQ